MANQHMLSNKRKDYYKNYRRIKSNVSSHIDFIYNPVDDQNEEISPVLSVDEHELGSYNAILDTPQGSNSFYSEDSLDSNNHGNEINRTGYGDAIQIDNMHPVNFRDSDSEYSIESELESDAEDDYDDKLRCSLADWASKNNITTTAVRELLEILHPLHPFLPKDPRTLLKTQTSYNIDKTAGGCYYHFGVAKGIRSQLLKYPNDAYVGNEHVFMQINIDGLPLFKNSGTQFWPILGRIIAPILTEPFIIGLYSGDKKPDNVHAYLEKFISEMNSLQENGLFVEELTNSFQISISCVICDAPARAYVKQIKNHNGFYGCDKCTQKGVRLNSRTTFPETNATLRTDVQFDEMTQTLHHTGISPFTQINMGLVSQFPLDYMHLVCLGVVKRLLNLWVKGPFIRCRIGASAVGRISDLLLSMRGFLPREFLRKGRSLYEVDRWKASEYRQFLLYTGPVVLRGILKKETYRHFMLLFLSIYLLSSPFFYQTYLQYAQELLCLFVADYPKLYGEETVSYNVHGLVHLGKDVEKFGPLEYFSAFVFESFLGKLKKLVRKPNYPLQQVIRRLSENNNQFCEKENTAQNGIVKKNHSDGPLPRTVHGYQQFREIHLPSAFLSLSQADNCILLGNKVGLVRNIVCERIEDEKYIVYEEFLRVSNFFGTPIDSKDMFIYTVSNLSGIFKVCRVSDITCKCVIQPYKDLHVTIPLNHTL